MTIASKPIYTGIYRGIVGVADALVFHAIDDVGGSFVNDVIVGIGVLTEARTSTIYLPDDTSPPIWQAYGSGVAGKVFANAKWWLYGAPAATNSQIQSTDLTNVEFTKVNMTAAKTSTGMRNDANGATRLTATAANATCIANAITDASDDQLTRWFIKRITGTGTINITVDGGSTWQDVTTEVDSTAGFNECLEDQAALANPQIGVRVVTDTDAVDVGNTEAHLGRLEAEVRQSSPIFTDAADVTINVTNLSVDKANHSETQGAYFMESMPMFSSAEPPASRLVLVSRAATTAEIVGYADIAGRIQLSDGTNSSTKAPKTWASGDIIRIGAAYGVAGAGEGLRLNVDDEWQTADDYDGSFGITIDPVLLDGTGIRNTCFMRNLRRYDLPYFAAQSQIDKLMA